MKESHLMPNGRFRSDKYKWCKPGFLPLKFTNETAHPWMYGYAALRGVIDREFQEDVHASLAHQGYKPSRLYSMVIHSLLFVQHIRHILHH